MNDQIGDIADYYNRDPEREAARLDRHQLEYELTWRYLDRYLPPSGKILEVGAAAGRYTRELARRGYALTSVDLSAVLIEECRKQLLQAGLEQQVQLLVADARNLQGVKDTGFDAVLLMGPLYHLVFEDDRKAALKEAIDRLCPGGIIVSSFISRLGILGDLMKNVPAWIEDQAEVRSILEQGRDPDTYHQGSFRGYFAAVSEIAPLHEAVGFETLVLAGVEPAISADDESYNQLQGEQRRLWLDLLAEISPNPSILAASRHLLYIGRKK